MTQGGATERREPDLPGTLDEQPNVVFIMPDQKQPRHTAREGFDLDTTPFEDELAAEGFWTDHAYCAVPQCVPSRSALLTGRTSSANGVRTNPWIQEPEYTEDVYDVLNAAGYRTAMVGKPHCYLTPEQTDHWYHVTHMGGSPRNERQERYDQYLDDLGFSTDFEPAPFDPDDTPAGRCVTDAIEWIDSLDGDDPFFLNLWLPEPHTPFAAPEPYFSMFDPDDVPEPESTKADGFEKGYDYEIAYNASKKLNFENGDPPDRYGSFEEALPEIRSIYYGMMRYVDDQVRRLVDFLDGAGVRENTLLIYMSDSGDYAGSYGQMNKGAGVCEAMTRVPFVATGPGVERTDGPHDAHVSLIDVLPTLAEVAGEPIPRGVQGRSLWPVLSGQAYPENEFNSMYVECGYGGVPYGREDADLVDPSARVFARANIRRGIRMGDWKLVHDASGDHDVQLYNLAEDPDEVDDVSASNPEKVMELSEQMFWWRGRLDAFEHPDDDHMQRNPHNWWDHSGWPTDGHYNFLE